MAEPTRRCGDRLRLPHNEATFHCQLDADHLGLHVSSHGFERITDQVMIDGGRLYEKVQLAVTWSRYQASTIEVGRNTPEWIEALSRGYGCPCFRIRLEGFEADGHCWRAGCTPAVGQDDGGLCCVHVRGDQEAGERLKELLDAMDWYGAWTLHFGDDCR